VRFYAVKISGAATLQNTIENIAIVNPGTPLAGIGADPIASIISPSVSGSQWSSVFNGQNDPGALDIDFDIEIKQGQSNGHITIYGIEQNEISQAVYLTGQRVQLFGGFTEGLYLANNQVPHQGLLADGQIYPAFGTWTGTELSLTLILVPGSLSGIGGPTDPKNIVHNLAKGSPLASAMQQTLQTAFPNSQFLINISNSLVLSEPDLGFYQGLEQYSNYIKSLSHSILGTPTTNGYQGVQIIPTGFNKYIVTDFTNNGGVIPLQFEDLIGQPTWINQNTIQIKTVLRADINAAMAGGGAVYISLPSPLLVNAQLQSGGGGGNNAVIGGIFSNAFSNTYQHGNVLLFTGQWMVTNLRHIGHYRQPTGESWVTIIEATSQQFSQGSVPTANANTGGQHSFGIGMQ
jgi:hypothetical protein